MLDLIEDSRQKAGKHEVKHECFERMGVKLNRYALPFGDYAYPPKISVDTKANMEEVVQNIRTDHARFKNECIFAKRCGCSLYILVETEWKIRDINDVHIWSDPNAPYQKRPVTGEQIEKAMKTMQTRYGVRFMFCHPDNSAEMILRILNGEFEDEDKS